MATSFNTFRLPQTHEHSQFIPYNGPPAPKSTSRLYIPKNASSIADKWPDINKIMRTELGSNTKSEDGGVLTPTSKRVESVDLACSDSRIDSETGRGGDDGNNDFHPQDERGSVGSQHSGSPRVVCVERRDESLNQPATTEGSSRENAVVIDDNQTDADTDEDDRPPWEDDTSTQTDNQLKGLGMSALECLSGESTPAGPEDVINSEIVEGAGIQGSTPTRRERVYTGGELSSTPKKRKLDQLNRPEDVNYNSDASARDGKEVGQSLRARKQRKSPTSHKNSLLDSQLPQEGTYRNSGNNNHDIKENRIEDERTVSTTPRASPSHQEPTSFRDMGPSHDEVGDGSHNHSLDGLIDDSTEEEEEEEDGSGSGGDDNDDDNKDESNDGDGDEDEKEDSSSDSEDDKDDGNNGGRKGQRYAERQRFSTSIRGSTASKRAVQRHPQQHRHSTSSVHESDRSTTYTSNLHKPLAHPKRSPRRARKPSLTDCLPESEGALKEASCANKGEWPIQGFLRRKRNGLYAMEFSLDHHHHQLPPPVDFVRQAQRLRPRPRFTAEEDALLIELKEEQNLLWERIRKHFPGRTVGSLQVHYSTKLKDKTAVRKRR